MGARDRDDSFPVVGVTSDVGKDGNKHVVFLDCEGVPSPAQLSSYIREVNDIYNLGPYALLNSSGKNYHVVFPKILDAHQVARIKDRFQYDDPTHLEVGENRGRWTLRISPKEGVGKQAPMHVATGNRYHDGGGGIYSVPHMKFYNTLLGCEFNIDKCPTPVDGFEVRVEKYWTWK